MADEAIEMAAPAIRAAMQGGLVKREHLHVIISIRDENSEWYTRTGYSFGARQDWEHPYDQVATSKDRISRRTGLPTREVQLLHPELLEPGDTIYFGNAMTENIIVSCSGVQAWGDEMFASIILQFCLGLIQCRLDRIRADGYEVYL